MFRERTWPGTSTPFTESPDAGHLMSLADRFTRSWVGQCATRAQSHRRLIGVCWKFLPPTMTLYQSKTQTRAGMKSEMVSRLTQEPASASKLMRAISTIAKRGNHRECADVSADGHRTQYAKLHTWLRTTAARRESVRPRRQSKPGLDNTSNSFDASFQFHFRRYFVRIMSECCDPGQELTLR